MRLGSFLLQASRHCRRGALACAIGVLAFVAVVGCQGEDFNNALLGPDGNSVRLNEIAAIVQNDEIDVFEKDAQLEALGVSDPALRQLFIDNPDLFFPPG